MSGDPHAAPDGVPVEGPETPRRWTPAAAAEPLPPLAPPPASPGAGSRRVAAHPGPQPGRRLPTAAWLVLVLLAGAVIVALAVVTGH